MDTRLNTATEIVYLSQLTLDMQRRDVWRLLGDTYALHRRVLTAFPEASDGGAGRVLFRVDSGKGEARLLVQSTVSPDWSRLPSGLCRDAPNGPKPWRLYRDGNTPIFTQEQRLRFRLRANPTYCCNQDGEGDDKRKKGRRYAHLTRVAQGDWLARKGEQHGFALFPVPSGPDWLDPFADETENAPDSDECKYDVRIVPLERLRGDKPASVGGAASTGHLIQHYSVDFDGVLSVTDPALFAEAVASGIGPAKGFGFGLLSLARA
jgi:CRISPR system Cascade subunit CasE